MDTKLN